MTTCFEIHAIHAPIDFIRTKQVVRTLHELMSAAKSYISSPTQTKQERNALFSLVLSISQTQLFSSQPHKHVHRILMDLFKGK